jgi:hypothetical protein
LGIAAAAGAAGAAWLQFQQHRVLKTSYALAEQELSLVLARLDHVNDEDEWAEFVTDAEGAISREHTTWLARRGLAGGRP